MHKMLIDQLNQSAELDQSNFLKQDCSFNALLSLLLFLTDLSRLLNTKKNGFSYALDISIFPTYLICFLENITKTCNTTQSDSGYSFQQAYDQLKLLVETVLRQIEYLNARLDNLNAECNRAERHFFVNDLRRTNQITEKLLTCFVAVH